MNTEPLQVTPEQVKRAQQLGYAAFLQQVAKSTAVDGVKAATDTADKLKGLVAAYGIRCEKKASRREQVYAAILAPA